MAPAVDNEGRPVWPSFKELLAEQGRRHMGQPAVEPRPIHSAQFRLDERRDGAAPPLAQWLLLVVWASTERARCRRSGSYLASTPVVVR